jgi:hypothetical protein
VSEQEELHARLRVRCVRVSAIQGGTLLITLVVALAAFERFVLVLDSTDLRSLAHCAVIFFPVRCPSRSHLDTFSSSDAATRGKRCVREYKSNRDRERGCIMHALVRVHKMKPCAAQLNSNCKKQQQQQIQEAAITRRRWLLIQRALSIVNAVRGGRSSHAEICEVAS